MVTAELLALKFQEVLGKQYKVHTNHAFNQRFTNPIETPYGESHDFNYQAFEEDADYIIATVKTMPNTLTNTPYALSAEQYTVVFWVPIDFVKMDAMGMLLETPKFDFFTDIKRLDNALRDKELRLTDSEGGKYKAFFTMSQPSLISNQVERAGCYTRVVFQCTGNVSISELTVGTGNDTSIAFNIDGEWHNIKHFNNLTIGATDEAAATMTQTSTEAKQDVAIRGQSVSFSVDDYVLDSPAMWLLEDKVFLNKEILTPDADKEDRRRKIKVKISKKSIRTGSTATTREREFWGILSVQYSANGKAGFGSYQVSITDDGKESG